MPITCKKKLNIPINNAGNKRLQSQDCALASGDCAFGFETTGKSWPFHHTARVPALHPLPSRAHQTIQTYMPFKHETGVDQPGGNNATNQSFTVRNQQPCTPDVYMAFTHATGANTPGGQSASNEGFTARISYKPLCH
jgi:hypothetical protein